MVSSVTSSTRLQHAQRQRVANEDLDQLHSNTQNDRYKLYKTTVQIHTHVPPQHGGHLKLQGPAVKT